MLRSSAVVQFSACASAVEPAPSSRVPLALFSFTVRSVTVRPTPGMPWKVMELTEPSTAIHERVSVPVAGVGAVSDAIARFPPSISR